MVEYCDKVFSNPEIVTLAVCVFRVVNPRISTRKILK